MTPERWRVMVFDSGVGALSIGSEIHRLLPWLDIVHVMDCDGFPYGSWEEAALCDHICNQLETLSREHQPDIVVVACNSASTAVLPPLRRRIRIPVVGVVPAIKPAAAITRSGVIGLLATPATIARLYTERLIEDFASHCTVIQVGSAVLAPAVERLCWEGEANPSIWEQVMAEFRERPRGTEMDTVVLACTHFPLVQAELSAAASDLTWVDSGSAIARRVRQLLEEAGATATDGSGSLSAVILGPREPTPALLQRFEQLGITESQIRDSIDADSARLEQPPAGD